MSPTTARPSRQGRQEVREAELPRTLALPPDESHQVTGRIDDDNPVSVKIQEVKVARAVEGRFEDCPELLPFGPVERADPEHLLEVGHERAILGGEVDDFLPGCGDRGQEEEEWNRGSQALHSGVSRLGHDQEPVSRV